MSAGQPPWVRTLSDDVWQWFQAVHDKNHPGRVRWCLEGDLFMPGARAGLGASCLALKTLTMLGLLDRLEPGVLAAWVDHIKAFQTAEGEFRGYFEDPALLRQLDHRIFWIPQRRIRWLTLSPKSRSHASVSRTPTAIAT